MFAQPSPGPPGLLQGHAAPVPSPKQPEVPGSVEQFATERSNMPLPAPVLIHFLTGAIFNLIAWWLDNDMPYPPEKMDEMFLQLAMNGLQSLFTAGPAA